MRNKFLIVYFLAVVAVNSFAKRTMSVEMLPSNSSMADAAMTGTTQRSQQICVFSNPGSPGTPNQVIDFTAYVHVVGTPEFTVYTPSANPPKLSYNGVSIPPGGRYILHFQKNVSFTVPVMTVIDRIEIEIAQDKGVIVGSCLYSYENPGTGYSVKASLPVNGGRPF